MNICKIAECGGQVFGHGWCQKHYARWRRTGSTFVCVGTGNSEYNKSGWHHTEETKKMIRNSLKGKNEGTKNGHWKGSNVSYEPLHSWLTRHFKKKSKCEHCGRNPGTDSIGRTKMQWANKTKKYLRKRNDWLCLCPSCHKKFDLKYHTSHKYSLYLKLKKYLYPPNMHADV